MKQFLKDPSSMDTIKKGTFSLIDQSLCSATNFVTAVMIARASTREEFGLYALAFAMTMFLAGVQSALLATPYTVLYPSMPPDRQAHYANVVQVQQLLFSVVTVLILVVAASVIVQVSAVGEDIQRLLWILPLATAAILLREHVRRMYFARLHMEAASVLDFAVLVIQLGGLAILFAMGLLGVASAYLIIAIACLLPSLVVLSFRMRGIVRAGFGLDDFIENNWRIGRWKLGTHLAVSVGTKAYPWLLAAFHGPAATAVYSACMSLFVVANPFMMGVRNFLVPKLSHHAADSSVHVKSLVSASTRLVATIMGTGLVLVCIFGGTVVEWIYSERYAGYGDIVCILALATMTWSLTAPHTDGLLALRRPDIELKSYLIAAVISLTFGAYLVYQYGILGASIAILLSDGVAAAVRFSAFRRISARHDLVANNRDR